MLVKRFISVLTVMAMVIGIIGISPITKESHVMTANANVYIEPYTQGHYENLTYFIHGNYIVISDCDESAVSVDIPDEINGIPVTVIDKGAFEGCSNIILNPLSRSNERATKKRTIQTVAFA